MSACTLGSNGSANKNLYLRFLFRSTPLLPCMLGWCQSKAWIREEGALIIPIAVCHRSTLLKGNRYHYDSWYLWIERWWQVDSRCFKRYADWFMQWLEHESKRAGRIKNDVRIVREMILWKCRFDPSPCCLTPYAIDYVLVYAHVWLISLLKVDEVNDWLGVSCPDFLRIITKKWCILQCNKLEMY